jgi:hypothetical protein
LKCVMGEPSRRMRLKVSHYCVPVTIAIAKPLNNLYRLCKG